MKKNYFLGTGTVLLLTLAVLIPLLFILVGALQNPEGLYQILIREPFYLYRFWKSLALAGIVVLFHLVVSCMAGFAFAKYSFPGKHRLYFLLIVLMMLPVQVTLVPNHIILDKLHLLNTWAALALPCIFNPFGTILMTLVFRSVSNEILDAAKVDGANTWVCLWRVLVPAARGGWISLLVLTFVDIWNIVEQPMVFLQNTDNYPLSVFLAVANETDYSTSFAGAILTMLPVFLLFLYFRDELAEGLTFTGVK